MSSPIFLQGNAIKLQDTGDACGLASCTVSQYVGLVGETFASTTSPYSTFAFGKATSGNPASWKLCWGHKPSFGLDTKVEYGTLVMNGPTYTSVTCSLAIACRFNYAGLGPEPKHPFS